MTNSRRNQVDPVRSQIMRSVRSKDTKPEKLVRSIVHSMGYRYRLHRRDLPGKPDLAFISARKAVFVNGCFWHGHACAKGRLPKTNVEFWGPKIEANKIRDEKNLRALSQMGWRTLTLWECELSDKNGLRRRIRDFLV